MAKAERLKNRRWKLWASLSGLAAILLAALGVLLTAPIFSSTTTHMSHPDIAFGPTTLEERIVVSDVIARVKLHSVAQSTEKRVDRDGETTYAGALEFTFDVLEYLKGSGGSQLKAVVTDGDVTYETELGASAPGQDLLLGRDTQWDDREAIVFLRKKVLYPSTEQTDRYWLGSLRFWKLDRYTIASRLDRHWLPAAAVPTPVSGGDSLSADTAVGSNGSEQLFLLEEPEEAVVRARVQARENGETASGLAEQPQPETVALSDLKALIAKVEAEVAAGGSSTEYTPEEYRRCVRLKYEEARRVRYYTDGGKSEYFYRRTDVSLASGSPVGSHVYYGPVAGRWLAVHGANEPDVYKVQDWIGGRDGSLFSAGYPTHVTTARPLPNGEYRFYYDEIPHSIAICQGTAQEEKERHEIFVNVTATADMVHEAFFDPVVIGAAIGADSTNGTLSSTEFTVDGSATALHSVKWEGGSVTLTLSPYVSLDGYALDFIELDGTVSLSLEASSATEDATKGTLGWAVASQPWHDGDQLMLRIRLLPCTDGVAVPNPTDNPGLVRDCQVLLEALSVMLGAGGDLLLWRDNKTMDDWRGVRMAGTPKRVTELHAAYKGLKGTLPATLGELDALTKVDLRGNGLTGSIPAELGGLAKLEYLNLKGNGLTGAIPSELGDLSKLERLYLDDNELSGAIPSELGNLTNLQRLYLNDNNLSGDIPSELGELSELSYVYLLASNELTGCVPASWEDIDKSDDPSAHGLSYCETE